MANPIIARTPLELLDYNQAQADATGFKTSANTTPSNKPGAGYAPAGQPSTGRQNTLGQSIEYSPGVFGDSFYGPGRTADGGFLPNEGRMVSPEQQRQLPPSQASQNDPFGNKFSIDSLPPKQQEQLRSLLPGGSNYQPQTADFANYSGGTDISKQNQQGFYNAKNAGITSPSDRTGANSMFNQFSSSQQTPTAVDNFVSQDPFLNSIVKTYQDQMSTQNQQTSLVQEYQNLLQSSGIQGIDTKLIDMRKVIDGSEQDIRNEITSAGGFGTESQVMALANARNKSLITNYNTLLATRNSKEKYLDTVMNLSKEDRQVASKRFDDMMNFGFKVAEYAQKMRTNANESFDRIIKAIGWQGLVNSLSPYELSIVEKNYGMPAGGATQAAQRETAQLAATQGNVAADNARADKQLAETIRHNKATENKTTGGGGSTTKFTRTQSNKGASNAGVPIEDFSKLSDDSKNYYINNYSKFQTILSNVQKGTEDAKAVIDEINSSNIPQDVKTNLTGKLKSYVKKSSGFNWWNPLTWGAGIYDATHK